MRKHYRKVKKGGKTYLKHRLVMEEKLGRELKHSEVVHHVNGDIHDNKPENLELMKRDLHGRLHHEGNQNGPRGEQVGTSKLTRAQVEEIMKATAKGESNSAVAKRFGVDRRLVCKLKNRQRWKHVTEFWPLRTRSPA
jgi:hypothetical protein